MNEEPRAAEVFQYLAERIYKRPELSETAAIIQFDILGEPSGTWVVDLTTKPGTIYKGAAEAPDCIITMHDDDFMALTGKQLNPVMAYLQGKVKIRGDMSLITKLHKILG